ncbi:hypothetical protein GQ600_14404 [Phytophthora cactorum]|nr:hypothetical protein GQ600_14404 [Phytophthora cactorum]
MEFLGKTTTADFRVKQVIRRFVESDRQVVVWVSIGHALDPNNSPFSALASWTKATCDEGAPCRSLRVTMSAGCRIDMTAAGDFTEFVLNVVAANTTTSQEIIENVLLDQALNKRQVETSRRILDDLSPELPAPADKAIKNISWTATIPTPKLLSQRLFKSRQVVPCSPPQPALAKPAKTPSPTQKKKKKPYVRKKPLSYNPNKARDERKLELIYLRQKVADMEIEFQKLQEIKEASRANADASESVTALAANHDSHSTNVGSAGSIESTEDTMVESFGMDMYDAKSNTKAEFNVKQILRRYVEEDRVVVVWRSHIMPLEFSNKRFAGIHFQEKGYVVIKPRAHSDNSSDDDDFTLVQTCYIITPDLSDQSLNDDTKTGALTDLS